MITLIFCNSLTFPLNHTHFGISFYFYFHLFQCGIINSSQGFAHMTVLSKEKNFVFTEYPVFLYSTSHGTDH